MGREGNNQVQMTPSPETSNLDPADAFIQAPEGELEWSSKEEEQNRKSNQSVNPAMKINAVSSPHAR
jgi:hypothetical protein